jgi:hypothetical protein
MVAAEKSVEEHWSKGKAWTAEVSKVIYVEVDYLDWEWDKGTSVDRLRVIVPTEIPFYPEPFVIVPRNRCVPAVSALPGR